MALKGPGAIYAYKGPRDIGIDGRLLWVGLMTVLLISALWTGTLSYFLHKADRAVFGRKIAGQTYVQIYKVEAEKYP